MSNPLSSLSDNELGDWLEWWLSFSAVAGDSYSIILADSMVKLIKEEIERRAAKQTKNAKPV